MNTTFNQFENRFTGYLDSFVVGERVWFFYTYTRTKKEKAEGMFEGVIVSFAGSSLNVAQVFNKKLDMIVNIDIANLNKC